MKTVFEGRVNGMVFDNVADYNAALVEALKHGDVNASSQTKTVPDETIIDTAEPTCECECETCCEEPDLFPGLDKEQYYMDDMVGDDETDKQTYNEWKEYLEGNFGEVVNYCEQLNEEEFDTYLNDLKTVALFEIEDDRVATEKAIESLVVEREDLKNRLHVLDQDIVTLKNAGQLNNMFSQYYQQLIAKLESMVAEEAPAPTSPIVTEVTESIPQMEASIEGIHKLLEEIFPGSFVRRK